MGTKKKEPIRKTLTDDFLNAIKNDEILSGAQKVISSAVHVLEEEIAAGILAAKKIENKILDVDDIRSDPDDLMNRIRRDTHEAVDLFLDALSAISKQVAHLTASVDNQASTKDQTVPKSKNESVVILLEPDHPLKAGQLEVLKFTLFEDSDEETKIKFQKTHLVGPSDQIVNSRALKIIPNTFRLQAKKEREISIQINLPKKALPGHYSAFISDANGSAINVLLKIKII